MHTSHFTGVWTSVVFLTILCFIFPTRAYAADPIAPLTVSPGRATTFAAAGVFATKQATFHATLTNGKRPPDWVRLEASTGILTFEPRGADAGALLHLRLTAAGSSKTERTDFYVLVGPAGKPDCQVDANPSRLDHHLGCHASRVQLRGFTSSGKYRWKGPGGFTSSKARPVVDRLGLYTLEDPGGGCGIRSVVEVTRFDGCPRKPDANQLPSAWIERRQGADAQTFILDGTTSADPDGRVVAYRWDWEDGVAVGPRPTVRLSEGKQEIILTVTDNYGAKSTDRISLDVKPAPPPPVSDSGTGNGNEYWLEAECATVGARWSRRSAAKASQGEYIVVRSGNSMSSAPAGVDSHVRFELGGARRATYYLFARVGAPTNLDDSFWVRVNGGSWYRWSSGLRQDDDFGWVRLPTKLALNEGSNTVDFAYREDGTQLDKVFITTDADAEPRGTGRPATNCGTPPPTASAAIAEAECGQADAGWRSIDDDEASGGSYLAFKGARFMKAPTSSNPGNQVRYELTTATAGTYRLYLRMHAPDREQNSVWVRVDDGPWLKFWKDTDGRTLLTDGLAWREVSNDGRRITFNLKAGKHTVRIANRETGTGIDKLYLSTDSRPPTGQGPTAPPCRLNSKARPTLSAAAPVATTLQLAPNPVVDRFQLRLRSEYIGEVIASIYDSQGREVAVHRTEKATPDLLLPLSAADLPAGMYQVRLLMGEGGEQLTRSFVRQ